MGMAKRKDQRPPFDICKVNTARLRALPRQNLERVWTHLGKRRASRDKGLVHMFVNALIWTKSPSNWGTKAQRSRKAGLATRTERRIWDAQQRRGCLRRPR
jgi:hypothetical protein